MIYTASFTKEIVKFVFRDGDRLLCVIKKTDLICEPITNLLYDQLKVCQRSATSEEIANETTPGSIDITFGPRERSANSNPIVIIVAVALLVLACFTLILVGIFVILKALLFKKEPENRRRSLKSEPASERSEADGNVESPLAAKSEITDQPSIRSSTVSSNQPLN